MSNMDTNEQFIEDATMVYLKAYDTAIRKVKNQQLAIIAATAISNNYMMLSMTGGKKETHSDPLAVLMNAVMNEKRKQEGETDHEDAGGRNE